MFLKKLLRKVIVLALIAGLGYGCWTFYNAKKDKQTEIDVAFSEAYNALAEELAKETPDGTEAVRQGAVMRAMYRKSKYYKGDETDLTILVETLYSASANLSELPVNEETKTILLEASEKSFAEKQVKAAKERVELIQSVLK